MSSHKRKSNSKYHPDRPCSERVLCGKSNAYYTHYQAWGERERSFLLEHCNMEPDPSSCMCIAHLKEAQRPHPSSYVPVWKRKSNKTHINESCKYPGCTPTPRVRLINPSFAPIAILKTLLNVESSSERPFLLCYDHYHEVYERFRLSSACACCGIQPKSGTSFNRHCPDVSIINQVLCRDDELQSNDYICLACYKHQTPIVKSIENPPDTLFTWQYSYMEVHTMR